MLRSLLQQQSELEDLFKLDASDEDIKSDKLAKTTYAYLKRRRRLISTFKKDLSIEDGEYERGRGLYEFYEHYILGL